MGKIYKTKLSKSIKHDYFSEENIKKYPERLVIVGFIAADGCISQPSTGQKLLIFNLSKKDKLALDIINNEICCGERNISNIKTSNSCMLTIPSNELCKDLEVFNIHQRKTYALDFPKFESLIYAAYFLRGYFYGDGCISDKGCFLMGNTTFSISIKKFLEENNIVDSCKLYRLTNNDSLRQIHMTGILANQFSKFIFFDNKLILLPRKHKIVIGDFKPRWSKSEILLFKVHTNKEICEITGRSEVAVSSYFRRNIKKR